MELGGALFSDGWRNDREERLRLGRPDGAAIDKNCGHPCGIEPHRVAAIGRELIVWEEFPNSREHEPPVFYPSETHSSKTDADPAVAFVSEDNLIRRQRHAEAVREDNERTGRAVADDGKRGGPIAFAQEGSRRAELDQEWKHLGVPGSTSSAGPTDRPAATMRRCRR
jgi:hypothetical protein